MASPKKRSLGKGLDALLGPSPKARVSAETALQPAVEGEQIIYLDPRTILPNPKQPRTTFREEALEELAASIRREGVQDPIIVRQRGTAYECVSGERRVRASIMADLLTIPAICREISDSDMLRLGLIDNIQREDLNAIELATAYQELIREFAWTQEELADQVGKKRATVANTLRLLNLPREVQTSVAEEKITMGHARALLALDSAEAQIAACRKIVSEGLSVRQVEKLASRAKTERKPREKDPHIAELEDSLRRHLGTRVTIRVGERQRGKIEVEFYNFEDLDRILLLLRGSK